MFQILYIETIWEGQVYQTLQRGTSSLLMTTMKLLFFIYSVIYPNLFQNFMAKGGKS